MKEGREKPRHKFEGLSPEQVAQLEELQEIVGGEEGVLAVEQQRLGMLLTDSLNALEIPDAEELVAGTLMNPENTEARATLLQELTNDSNARKAAQLLRELDRFLAKNAIG